MSEVSLSVPIASVNHETRVLEAVIGTETRSPTGEVVLFAPLRTALEQWSGRVNEMADDTQQAGNVVSIDVDEPTHSIRLRVKIAESAEECWAKVRDETLSFVLLGGQGTREAGDWHGQPATIVSYTNINDLSLVDTTVTKLADAGTAARCLVNAVVPTVELGRLSRRRENRPPDEPLRAAITAAFADAERERRIRDYGLQVELAEALARSRAHQTATATSLQSDVASEIRQAWEAHEAAELGRFEADPTGFIAKAIAVDAEQRRQRLAALPGEIRKAAHREEHLTRMVPEPVLAKHEAELRTKLEGFFAKLQRRILPVLERQRKGVPHG